MCCVLTLPWELLRWWLAAAIVAIQLRPQQLQIGSKSVNQTKHPPKT
jgi:hypothetical protein